MQYTIYQILSGFMSEYVHTCDSVSDSFGDDVIFAKLVEALLSNVYLVLYLYTAL